MATRRWGQWPKRIADEANATNGIVAILGGGVTAAGVVLSAPLAAAMGGVVILGAAGWCAWKGFPPRLAAPSELVGKVISAGDVSLIDPPVTRLGFVGASQVGKTTLLSHMAVRPSTNSRTDRITATIIAGQTTPQKFLALFDGAGQHYTQQFDIIDYTNVLLIFLDHNTSGLDDAVEPSRLKQHSDFVDQMRTHITSKKLNIDHVYFVLNKSDLWRSGRELADLRVWFESIVDDWKKSGISSTTSSEHSNNSPSDVTLLVNRIFAHAS